VGKGKIAVSFCSKVTAWSNRAVFWGCLVGMPQGQRVGNWESEEEILVLHPLYLLAPSHSASISSKQ
jgi:hypothetical protein